MLKGMCRRGKSMPQLKVGPATDKTLFLSPTHGDPPHTHGVLPGQGLLRTEARSTAIPLPRSTAYLSALRLDIRSECSAARDECESSGG